MPILIYKLIEYIDGEKHLKLMPYNIAQKIKMFLLTNFISFELMEH